VFNTKNGSFCPQERKKGRKKERKKERKEERNKGRKKERKKEERIYPMLQRDVWAPGSFWTGAAKRKRLTPKGVLTPKCPFLSESLSRKQEPFYPVGYAHRSTNLGVVSRH